MAVWLQKIKIDLKGSEDYREARDEWVTTLKSSTWYYDNSFVQALTEELAYVDGLEEMNYILSDIYDMADIDRVWIEVAH